MNVEQILLFSLILKWSVGASTIFEFLHSMKYECQTYPVIYFFLNQNMDFWFDRIESWAFYGYSATLLYDKIR
jgi:hypothetical protein